MKMLKWTSVYFRSFQTIYKKSVDFSRIRTQIVGVKDKHADHLTTTTAHWTKMFAMHLNQNGPLANFESHQSNDDVIILHLAHLKPGNDAFC